MIRVYTASKLHHAAFWKNLELNWPFIIFHARWLRHVAIGTPDDMKHAERFWLEDQEDVQTSDAVLIYAENGEHIRGALVEAGIALSSGIPVIVVGEHLDYGTWQYHPGVQRVGSFDGAAELLSAMNESMYEDRQ